MNAAGIEVEAPVLSMLDVDTVSNFLKERDRYLRSVEDKNVGKTGRACIIPISLKASISQDILQSIACCGYFKSSDDLSDKEIKNYLKELEALAIDENYHTMAYVFEGIEMNPAISTAKCRVADMWAQWFKAKAQFEVGDRIQTKKGKKILEKKWHDVCGLKVYALMFKMLWKESRTFQILLEMTTMSF